jgi:hypothetical protein
MRGVMTRRVLCGLIAAAVATTGGGVAFAATTHHRSKDEQSAIFRLRVDVQATYSQDGDPALVANFAPNGGLAKPHWLICSPAHPATCTPAPTRGQLLEPGPTPVGTVFDARVRYRGKTYDRRSATWLGTLHAASRPTISGTPRYQHRVAAHGGTWSGGWQAVPGYQPPRYDSSAGRAPSFDVLTVEACRTASAHQCVNLTPQDSTRPPLLGAALTSRFLFAFDQHYAPDTAFAGVGYLNAAAVPPLRTNPTISRSTALGPITGPQAPHVTVLHHAITHSGHVFVARVRCSVRCHIRINAFGKTSGSTTTTNLTGARLIGVPRRRMAAGPLEISLFVGDGPEIKGTSLLD